jgi:hypothetical protein
MGSATDMAKHQQQPPPTQVSSPSETVSIPASDIKFSHEETLRLLNSNNTSTSSKRKRSIQKPLPLILSKIESSETDGMRQQRLTVLERLHERQVQEQQGDYLRWLQQQQQQHFANSQNGRHGNSGRDAGQPESSEQDDFKNLPEVVWAVRGAQVVFGILLMGFLSYGEFLTSHC